ncbi:MAG: hypothetical protein N2253_05400 [Bacteroidia bacterium]|nr:hypothetical protein [Bacteroidia bacterium]MCX7764309.1 hypothetical protein [Bacteroidia bacterium]MDW8057879.1 hypothetical protein [Bacteroidia bacterium]
MRMWFVLLWLGLVVWAQTPEVEPRLSLHYDGSRQVLVLSADAIAPSDRLEILDLIGRRVRLFVLSSPVSEGLTVSVADLPEGLYYARWITEQGRVRAIRRFSVSR